jgi:hypothetical protein
MDWAGIIDVATLLTLVAFVWQLYVMRKQYRNDHERSRREAVINLQRLWMENLDKKTRHSRQFLEYMSPKTCKKFWEGKEIEVAYKHKDILLFLCECKEEHLAKNDESGEFIVAGEQLVTIKTFLIGYLNLLEVIFTAWNANVGDREMIEDEFGRNVITDKGEYPLDNILSATNFFPSIKAYTAHKKSSATAVKQRNKL